MKVNSGKNVFPVVNEKFLEALDDKAKSKNRNDSVLGVSMFHSIMSIAPQHALLHQHDRQPVMQMKVMTMAQTWTTKLSISRRGGWSLTPCGMSVEILCTKTFYR